MFHGLRDRYPGDQIRFIEEQIKLGLDTVEDKDLDMQKVKKEAQDTFALWGDIMVS